MRTIVFKDIKNLQINQFPAPKYQSKTYIKKKVSTEIPNSRSRSPKSKNDRFIV